VGPISPVLGHAVMDMVVYNGRLYAAPVNVVVVGWGVYTYNGVGGGWFGSWGFIMVNYMRALGVARLKLGSSNAGIVNLMWVVDIRGGGCMCCVIFF